jgi:hypothetical protein
MIATTIMKGNRTLETLGNNLTTNNEMETLNQDVWTSQDVDKIYPSLLAFHKNPPSLVKEGIILMHNKERKYMTLDSIFHAVRPALAKEGIFITQHLAGDSMTTMLIHESGQFLASKFPFQNMNGSGTNNLQNLGGGLTYLRRYALTAILGIAADEDNDGEGSTLSKPETKSNEPKANEPEKWLNRTNKAGEITPEWTNLMKGISDGKVNTLADVRKVYKVSKSVAVEVEEALGL